MMRVLMFVPQYPYPIVGGLEKQSHELAKALVAKGVDVSVLSGQVAEGVAGEEIVEGIRVTRIPWCRSRLVRYMRSPWDVARALTIRRREFDVLHLHQFSPVSLYLILLAKLMGKSVLTKLPNVGELGLPGLRLRPLGWLRLKILLGSHAIVAMSEESRQELGVFRFPLSRVLLVPNGIDLSRIPVRATDEATNGTDCRIVFVGRLHEQKQLATLLEAWSLVRQTCPRSATLHLWGDGPLASDLRSQAVRLGLAETVRFEGHVKNVMERLREMDIFVLSSRVEGNSNALLESMAAGLPIVGTAVGGTPMLVGAEGAPFLCAPGDRQALAIALERLIEDAALRLATGAAMRRRAEEYFEIGRIAGVYLQAYHCLAQGRAEEICHVGHPVLMTAGESA